MEYATGVEMSRIYRGDMKRGLFKHSKKRIIISTVVVLFLIINGLLVCFVLKYPSVAANFDYYTEKPSDFNISEAKQVLEKNGYRCNLESTGLEFVDSSHKDSLTYMWLKVNESENEVRIYGYRENYVRMPDIFGDLYGIEEEQQKVAKKDVMKAINILKLPTNGSISFRNEIDSLDYFIPATVFYLMIFGYLPMTIFVSYMLVKWSRTKIFINVRDCLGVH